jgi:hypothetical protein
MAFPLHVASGQHANELMIRWLEYIGSGLRRRFPHMDVVCVRRADDYAVSMHEGREQRWEVVLRWNHVGKLSVFVQRPAPAMQRCLDELLRRAQDDEALARELGLLRVEAG